MITSILWLRFWSIALAASGLLIILSLLSGIDWPLGLFVDIAFWPIDNSPRVTTSDAKFFAVIVGGLTAGFCLMAGLTLDRALRTGDAPLVRIVAVGLVTWFMLDSAGSIAVGAWMNVVLNVIIVGGFLVPIAFWKPTT